MIIRDTLYGQFSVPAFLDALLAAPEFRRLSEVRLININSVSLSALSETRRYSHTLGVLRLALSNPLLGLDEVNLKALLASIIVHDAGTPAFAHLFEYLLKERFSWDHESGGADLITATGNKSLIQIFGSQTPQFRRLCEESRIDFSIVTQFLNKQHSHSKLIFGSLDFDNIDNVARMAWMLGHRFDVKRIESLASEISIIGDGLLALPESSKADVELWLQLRRLAYDVLVFDAPTVSAQAVLTEILDEALRNQTLDLTDWRYDDRDLLNALSRTPASKKKLGRDYFGELPRLCVIYQETEDPSTLARRGRTELTSLMREFVAQRSPGSSSVYGYVFRDRGAFSKKVSFYDPVDGSQWSVGDTSDSLILYGFAKGVRTGEDRARVAGEEFRKWLELH